MDTNLTRKLAAGAIGGTGLIHLALVPEYLGEQGYLGALFLLGAVAAGILTVRLWRADDLAAWGLGALLCAGMAIGFVLSRTVGLPGFHEGEWELSGILTLVLEGGFIYIAATAVRTSPSRLARGEA
jgi:hypothetical protein